MQSASPVGRPDRGGTILVTGGSGFIGKYLVGALSKQGRQVRILDVRPPKCPPLNVEFVAGSACDARVVDDALTQVTEIYHLAGIPGMWTLNKQDFFSANCRSTEVMLAAARKHHVARFVHCSTESVLFGRAALATEIAGNGETTIEEMPGVYTRSKKAAEQLAMQAAQEGSPVVVASPTMPIGPHDYELTPPTAMIRRFLHPHARFYIDFIMNIVDVRDVAAGLILTMERGRIGQRYILGGENTSLRLLLDAMTTITGQANVRLRIPGSLASAVTAAAEFLADHLTRRQPFGTAEGVEIARRSRPISSEKAQTELGYKFRNLNNALSETIRWLEAAETSSISS